MLVLTSILITAFLSSVFTSVTLVGLAFSLKNRIISQLFQSLNEYFASFVQNVKENPKTVAEMLKPVLGTLMEDFAKQNPVLAGEGGGDLMAMAQLLPRKYRMFLPLIQLFMGKKTEQSQTAANENVFG